MAFSRWLSRDGFLTMFCSQLDLLSLRVSVSTGWVSTSTFRLFVGSRPSCSRCLVRQTENMWSEVTSPWIHVRGLSRRTVMLAVLDLEEVRPLLRPCGDRSRSI